MNKERLGLEIRRKAKQVKEDATEKIIHEKPGQEYCDAMDVEELLLVLARIVEGKSLERSFGAPGAWGYNTEIGSALASNDGESVTREP